MRKNANGTTRWHDRAVIGATSRRGVLLLQLLGTAAALGWVPGNGAKLAAMATIWVIGFGRVSRAELLLMVGVNVLFTAMNLGALHKGVFRFNDPNLLGMPVYEFLMWGFYVLHTIRFIGGRPPGGTHFPAMAMAAAFALPFSTIGDPTLLALASGAVLGAGFLVFHEGLDFAYAAYMVMLGAVIEYVGVGTGQWTYPGDPYGGVPLWSAVMWAGIGLFTRRLIVPLLHHVERSQAV